MPEADPREEHSTTMDQASQTLLSLAMVRVEPGPYIGFRPCEREVALEGFCAANDWTKLHVSCLLHAVLMSM